MKKVAVFFAIIPFLFCFSSCDFLRTVAGRPTSDEIKVRSAFVKAHKQSLSDGTKAEMAARKLKERMERDSLETQRRIDSLGVSLSSVFRFGAPVRELQHKYNAIVGVFRQRPTATHFFNSYSAAGFKPFYIDFPMGETALCLGSSDMLSEVAEIIVRGRKIGLCPADVWIYCKQ